MHEYYYKSPPGTYFDTTSNPVDHETMIEIAILNEHRLALYFWLKWTNRFTEKGNNKVPSLITIDWHNDLAPLSEHEKSELLELNQNDSDEISRYSCFKLNPQNDGHIHAALYLNALKDVYVLSKQPDFDDEEDKFCIDLNSNKHKIEVFRNVNDLVNTIKDLQDDFYLDIDLDYFVDSDDICGDEGKLMENRKIKDFLDPRNHLFKTIYDRIRGFTIAREPTFCNGLKNSNVIMDLINERLFNNTLLTKNVIWKT